jgi:hypothetical protein
VVGGCARLCVHVRTCRFRGGWVCARRIESCAPPKVVQETRRGGFAARVRILGMCDVVRRRRLSSVCLEGCCVCVGCPKRYGRCHATTRCEGRPQLPERVAQMGGYNYAVKAHAFQHMKTLGSRAWIASVLHSVKLERMWLDADAIGNGRLSPL